jgi:hypothetical protein
MSRVVARGRFASRKIPSRIKGGLQSNAVTELTTEQEARFPEFARKWIDIGLSTQQADRERFEAAIGGHYAQVNRKKPRVIWLPCPISAALSAVCYARLVRRQLVGRSGNDVSVDSAIRSSVDVDTAVGNAIRSAVCDAVDSAINSRADVADDGALRSVLSTAVINSIRRELVRTVRDSVRGRVYLDVCEVVDNAVRNAVGEDVDSAIRGAVDSAVVNVVDSATSIAIGSAVRRASRACFGGATVDAGCCAWADYFNEVFGIATERNFLEIVQSCGYYWTLHGVCFASERPSEIHLDNDGRLHCETGMSVRYAGSGWGLFRWHGVSVPDEWSLSRGSLTPSKVLKHSNVEQRRAAIEMLGWARILSDLNARTIDSDPDPQIGDLVEVELPDLSEKVKFLRVKCGTGRDFAIGVPPHITKALDAQAWVVGLEPAEFVKPEVRA